MRDATVAWFNNQKGFGYAVDVDNKLIFLHYSAIKDNSTFKKLDAGQKVKVESKQDGDRLRATLVIPRGSK
jgi:cold shock CspA family protein